MRDAKRAGSNGRDGPARGVAHQPRARAGGGTHRRRPSWTFTRGLIAVAVLIAAGALTACGSGGGGTVAEQAQQAASTVAAAVTSAPTETRTTETRTTETRTTTATTPTATTTVTTTATASTSSPTTVTETTTASTPAPTTSVSNQTTGVVVSPPAGAQSESSSGLPWWGWGLIALAVIAIAMGVVALRRTRGAHTDGGTGGDGPAPRDGAPVAGVPDGRGVAPTAAGAPGPPADGATGARDG